MKPTRRVVTLGLLGTAAGIAAATATAARRPAHASHHTASRTPAAITYAGREDVRRFAADVAERRGWDAEWLERQLGRAQLLPVVRRLVMPPAAGTAKNWQAYRARFVETSRIQAGLRFWESNASWLERAEAEYGVPPEIVVGIVGVETFYGRVMGDFRLIDALSTLAFDFPPGRRDRSDFFRTELEELFVLAQAQGIAPDSLRGSYAGATGLPQFMPSSVNKYAIDFDGDQRIDLSASGPDVVGSVANYLASYGWQRGMPTHHAVAAPVDTTARATLLAPDIVPTFSAAQMTELGARLTAEGQAHEGPLALVELQNGDAAPSYVAGTRNFYVVTRYNWSSYYAMAVIDLAGEIARARRTR